MARFRYFPLRTSNEADDRRLIDVTAPNDEFSLSRSTMEVIQVVRKTTSSSISAPSLRETTFGGGFGHPHFQFCPEGFNDVPRTVMTLVLVCFSPLPLSSIQSIHSLFWPPFLSGSRIDSNEIKRLPQQQQ